ncbi:T9SS type A sorting domain-containing protein [Flavobacterium sp. RNTU_13]|uniref:T9SS type A sorting domain-containing protein n=1 Tax=Flavobacterium sp. RNTU_13 TaxID=3375145 RepID=UPI0039857406
MKKLYVLLLLIGAMAGHSQINVPPQPAVSQCDLDTDGFATVALTPVRQNLQATFPEQTYRVGFFPNMVAAMDNTGQLPEFFTNTTPFSQTIIVKVWEIENPENAGYADLQLYINVAPQLTTPTPIVLCDADGTPDGFTIFNLNNALPEILQNEPDAENLTVTFYQQDVSGGAITNPGTYINTTNPQTVFVMVRNTQNNCAAFTTLTLQTTQQPMIPSLPAIHYCGTINLTENSALYSNYTATYYETEEDAFTGTAAIATPQQYSAAGSGTVWIRLNDDNSGCFSIVEQAYLSSGITALEVMQNGSSITLNTTSNTEGYIFTIVNAPPLYEQILPFSQSLPTFTNLSAGGYTINVQDTCGNMFVISFEVMDAPEGDTEQTFTEGETIANLTVNGTNIAWYAERALITPLPTNTPLTDGTTYYATQVFNSGKSIPLGVTARLAAGTEALDKNRLQLYPNPVSHVLTVTNNNVISTVAVYNTLGACVYRNAVGNVSAQLNLSELAPGVYFVRVEGNGYLKTSKIVKK